MDNDAVVLMHNQVGRFTGAEVLPAAVAPRYRAAWDAAWQAAVPFGSTGRRIRSSAGAGKEQPEEDQVRRWRLRDETGCPAPCASCVRPPASQESERLSRRDCPSRGSHA